MRFLLVDRISEVRPGAGARGWKNAAMAEDYFEWHFPERPIVPGVLVLEAFAQLAGWFLAAGSDFRDWFALDRVASARWYAFAGPGDRIDLSLEAVAADGDRRTFRGEASVGGKRSATVEFEGTAVPLADLTDPARARASYAVLRGEGPGADTGGRA